jgi:hypothetical protein
MRCHHIVTLALVAGLGVLSGCGKKAATPLSSAECKEAQDKQIALMMAELPPEYRAGLDKATLKADFDCAAPAAQAQQRYECLMASSSLAAVQQCVANPR